MISTRASGEPRRRCRMARFVVTVDDGDEPPAIRRATQADGRGAFRRHGCRGFAPRPGEKDLTANAKGLSRPEERDG